MAKKRSLVDAVLTVTAASDIFTQDVEEMVENGTIKPKENRPPVQETKEEDLSQAPLVPAEDIPDFQPPGEPLPGELPPQPPPPPFQPESKYQEITATPQQVKMLYAKLIHKGIPNDDFQFVFKVLPNKLQKKLVNEAISWIDKYIPSTVVRK
jgi:hypothetical protein